MAQLWNDIKITTCEGRPCWVNGRRAIFHRWTDSARPVKQAVTNEDGVEHFQKYSVHGLVEYEDGTTEREWPNVIQFADSDQYFQKFDWDSMEHRRDARAAAAILGVPAEEITDETDPAKLQEKTAEHLKELDQAEPPAFTIETNSYCHGCAHEHEYEDFCPTVHYDCQHCSVMGCPCKHCGAGSNRDEMPGQV